MGKASFITINCRGEMEEDHEDNGIVDQPSAERIVWLLIKQFNRNEVSMYGKEASRRRVTNIKFEGESNLHIWEKTNLVTKMMQGTPYDAYKCKTCGVTGKRFGLNEHIPRDKKYKHPRYRDCDWKK